VFASPSLFLGLSFCNEEEDLEDEPQTNDDASVWICQKARSNYKNLTPKLREKCDANVFRTTQWTPNTLLQLSLSLSLCLRLPFSSWVWVFVVKKTWRMSHKPMATPAFESARKFGRITKIWHPNWEKNVTQMFLGLHNGLQTRCYSFLSLSVSPSLFLSLFLLLIDLRPQRIESHSLKTPLLCATDSKSHHENTLEDHFTNKLQKKAAEVCYKNKTGACIAYKNLTVLLSPAASTGPPFPPPLKTSVTDR